MLERRIDDYWNIDPNRDTYQIRGLDSRDSPDWKKNLQMEETTSRPDYLWPEIWKDMSEAAQRKEKTKWAIDKPKLDNARSLRGIHFIDPADAEFKETTQNARRKLEVLMPAAMPCKISGRTYKETCRNHASWLPTNPRESVWKELYTKIMKTTLQGKESMH